MAVSYDNRAKKIRELIVLINDTIVKIDVLNNVKGWMRPGWADVLKFSFQTVNVGGNENTRLPATVGDADLYHETDIITLKSQSGFTVQCNLKFDICTLEVSGKWFNLDFCTTAFIKKKVKWGICLNLYNINYTLVTIQINYIDTLCIFRLVRSSWRVLNINCYV